MPLNTALIGASTAAGGAAVTALPIPVTVQAIGSALVMVGTMIMSRRHPIDIIKICLALDQIQADIDHVRTSVDKIRSDNKRASEIAHKQTELLERLEQCPDHSGPHSLPPPHMRRIS